MGNICDYSVHYIYLYLTLKHFWAAPVAEWLRALIFHNRALSFDHLTAVSGVGSSPTRGTCETSQVLLLGVSGGFSRGSPVFDQPTDWPVSYELK